MSFEPWLSITPPWSVWFLSGIRSRGRSWRDVTLYRRLALGAYVNSTDGLRKSKTRGSLLKSLSHWILEVDGVRGYKLFLTCFFHQKFALVLDSQFSEETAQVWPEYTPCRGVRKGGTYLNWEKSMSGFHSISTVEWKGEKGEDSMDESGDMGTPVTPNP